MLLNFPTDLFSILEPQKFVDRRTCCSSEMMINAFRGFKIAKETDGFLNGVFISKCLTSRWILFAKKEAPFLSQVFVHKG